MYGYFLELSTIGPYQGCFKDVLTFLFYIFYSLEQAAFPSHLLPVVVKPDAVAGKLQRPFYNIPVGTPVGVGLGDFQCSVLASMSQQSDAGDVNLEVSLGNVEISCSVLVV